MYGPPSSGQQIGTGNCARSTSDSSITVNSGRRGGRRFWRELGDLREPRQHRELGEQTFGHLEGEQLGDARADVVEALDAECERHAPFRAEEIDRHRILGLPAAAQRRLCEQQCRPPPGDFMQRSATSVTSLSTDTGRSTRVRSPVLSIAATNSRRLSSAIVDGADAAVSRSNPTRENPAATSRCDSASGSGNAEHRLWQVGIGVPMFDTSRPMAGRIRWARTNRPHRSGSPPTRGAAVSRGRFDGRAGGFGVTQSRRSRQRLREAARVLKPVRASSSSSSPRRFACARSLFYFRRILPAIGRLVSKHRDAYTYLPESVLAFPEPEALSQRLVAAGFSRVGFERLTVGICAVHYGTR